MENVLKRAWSLFFLSASILLFSYLSAYSTTIEVEDISQPIHIGEYWQMKNDPEGSLSFEAVTRDLSNWQVISNDTINTGFNQQHYWFKFTVRNNTRETLYLNLDYPQIYQVDFYYQLPSQQWYKSSSGSRFEQQSREFDYRYYVFKLAPVNEAVTYYIHIENMVNLTTKPSLCTMEQLLKEKQRDDFLYAMYLGFVIFGVIFNLIFFANSRDRSYIYLILYILGWLGFHLSLGGLAFQYIWPHSPQWEQKSFLIITPLVGLFAIFFFRNYLETRRFKWIDRFFLYVMLPSVIIDLGLALFASRITAMQFTTIRGTIFTIFNISAALYVYAFKKQKSALYLFFGFLGIPLSIILMRMEGSGAITIGFISSYSNILANIWLIIWLTIGVSHKFFRVEQRAIKSEREYDLLKDAIMDGYLIYDEEGKVRECNEAFCSMIKYSATDITSKNISSFTADDPSPQHIIKEQLSTRSYTDVFEKDYLTAEKKILPIEYRIYQIEDDLDHSPRYMEILRDISGRKEAERRLRHSQKIDAIGKLAGGIAHDFNNMLAGIMGGADIISYRLKNNDIPGSMKYVNIILDTSKRAARLTNQLLNISRTKELIKQDIDICTVISDVVQLLERTIDKKIKVYYEKSDENLIVNGDADSIHNAFLNMGINSRDAINEEGSICYKADRIFLKKKQLQKMGLDSEPGSYVRVSVADDGCGISPDHIDQIFDPYFTTRRSGKGTGLGLASVYSTIEEHQGTIEVKSELNEGTTFTLYFKESDTAAVSADRSQDHIEYNGTGAILVAEDEEPLQEVLEEILSSLGYTVTIARDGEEALSLFHKGDFDLILLDVIMPRKSGVEVFYEICKKDPSLPVILASGYADNIDLGKLKKDGLSAFIRKPFTREELARFIHASLHEKK